MMVHSLFPPVSAQVFALVEGLEPAMRAGATFTASAASELALELVELASSARALEVVGDSEGPGSRRLFALAGAVEKHRETGFLLPAGEARLLSDALRRIGEALRDVEAECEALARAPVRPACDLSQLPPAEERRARLLEAVAALDLPRQVPA